MAQACLIRIARSPETPCPGSCGNGLEHGTHLLMWEPQDERKVPCGGSTGLLRKMVLKQMGALGPLGRTESPDKIELLLRSQLCCRQPGSAVWTHDHHFSYLPKVEQPGLWERCSNFPHYTQRGLQRLGAAVGSWREGWEVMETPDSLGWGTGQQCP